MESTGNHGGIQQLLAAEQEAQQIVNAARTDVETVMGIVDTHGETSAEDPTSWDEIVDLVESMEVVAVKAKEMAEKAAEMVKEANDTTETAKREMTKALGVMRKVKWNV
ncbi:hypothetical protein F2Q70_00032976 [Brassica cretica]|uniref:Uncharacterized protein n=2 Tax=Brassica cretica TaxID=69181 RepID=A0A8S9FIR5_BRACR|nr:hypothetical protein F2Q70_00032976 [Brassica cretica]